MASTTERGSDGIIIGSPKAQMQVTGKAFGVLETLGPSSEHQRIVRRSGEVAVHALRGVQPFLLTSMAGQCGQFPLVDGRRIDIKLRSPSLPQRSRESMRRRVIECYGRQRYGATRTTRIVRHAAGESCGHRKPASDHVILHVIMRWVGKNCVRLNLANQSADSAQEWITIKNLQIPGHGRVPPTATRCH